MLRVLFIPLDDAGLTRAAWDWLAAQADIAAVRRPADGFAAALPLVRPDVLWIDGAAPPSALPSPLADLAEPRVPADVPGLLCTRGAAALPSLLGIEPAAPSDPVDRIWNDADDDLYFFDDFTESPRLRGHAAFRRHRLFRGLGSGAYTWCPAQGERDCRTTWRQPAWPVTGRVVAVERAFIHVNPARATIWEYDAPRRILCIGAYLPYDSADRMLDHVLDRLTRNALLHAARRLTTDAEAPDLHWPSPDPRTVHDPALALPDSIRTDRRERLPLEIAPVRYPIGRTADDPFTLAGRRAFLAGLERTGVAELWIHPLRVLRVETGAGVTTGRIEVSPLGMTRHIRPPTTAPHLAPAGDAPSPAGERIVTERTAVLRDLPAAVFEWEPAERAATPAAHVVTTFLIDLRLMWPYPAGVLGPLHWNAAAGMLRVRAPSTGEEVVLCASGPVEWTIEDASDETTARLRCTLRAALARDAPLRLTVVAHVLGDRPAATLLEAALDAGAHVRVGAAALARRCSDGLRVDAPGAEVKVAIECALARLDSYSVETPGLGRSLVAGYWTSRPGWNEGRPGYAWYFGRDAVWTALASLGAGDFPAARDVIAFLARHQDLSGKVLHECTTSGSIHYDAADATPLWLLLVARYHAWTGDAGFVRSVWTHVGRAVAFCLSTDTDMDGLIENTRAGHGWIEFGRLGGGKVTYYNAGIWTAALRELALVARDLGERAFATELEERGRTARVALERLFWDGAAGAYALKASDDRGGWTRDMTLTATHAVPLLLGVADATRAGRWLDTITTPAFTAEWGVRMIARTEPGFDPASYHGGAVWPLCTGWVSWAEFAAGRSEAGFRHWRKIIALAFEGEKGAWEEVLHGTERRSIGVCPDQAWSTAMAIAPFVHGLLGAEPDATRGRLRLRPQIPAAWDRLDVRGLRIGDSTLSMRYRRGGQLHSFTVEQVTGAVPLRLIFEPALAASHVISVRIDGIAASLDIRRFGERLLVPIQLALDHARNIEIEVA